MVHKIVIGWYQIIESRTILIEFPIIGALLCFVITSLMANLYVNQIEPIIVRMLKTKKDE